MMNQNRKLGDANYGTHMTPLVTAVMNTKGPVLEMGCGDFSTPLLHAICTAQNKKLLSTDTSYDWIKLFLDMSSPLHTFDYIPVYSDDQELNPKPHLWNDVGEGVDWGVVFIDHRPGDRRKIDIIRMTNKAEIIVVHDTETMGYDYEPALMSFKYRFDYKRYSVHTTLVSNVVDVSALF